MTRLFKKVKQTLFYKTPMGEDNLFGDRVDNTILQQAELDGRNAAVATAGPYTTSSNNNNNNPTTYNNEYPWYTSSERHHVSSSAWDDVDDDFSSDNYYDGFPAEDTLGYYDPRLYERHERRFADYPSSPSTGFSDQRRASTTRDFTPASFTSSLPGSSRRGSISNSPLQGRRPSGFSTTPITRTHPAACICIECIISHRATQLPSRGERRASATRDFTPASFTSSLPRSSRAGSISNSPLQTCSICAEDRQSSEFPIMSITSTCTHPVTDTCKECIRRHLATQLSSRGTATLQCICNQPLSLDDVQRNADPKDFARYCERATMEMLESDSQFIWCPAQGCGAGQLQQRGSDEPKVTCARCRQPFCFIHHVRWHAGMTCREFDQNPELADEARARENAYTQGYRREQRERQELSNQQRRALEAAAREKREREAQERENESYVRQNATPCPSCKYMTQKDGGCKHMTCVKCRFEFCWECKKTWMAGHLSKRC